MGLLLWGALLFLFPLGVKPAQACTDQTPCEIGDRSYHVRVPDNWDGATPLPVLLHFHGWGRQGTLIVRHGRIATGIVADQVLLVAPNGLRNSWQFFRPGSPDTTFAKSVLEDVARRYPIDREKIFVSGYSWGANMAWRFACESDMPLAALIAVSGTLDQSERCAPNPRHVHQVFGLDDQVLRFPMGPGGDQTYPVQLWRDLFDCAEGTQEGTWNARPFLTFTRNNWTCPGGDVVLDVHPGGHFIPHDWIPLQVQSILEHS